MAMLLIIVGGGMMFGYFDEIAEGNSFEVGTLDFLGVVFFAPLLETFLLSGLLAFLSILKKPIPVIAAISACIWGGLHGIAAPLWFFGTVIGFFVFSCAYLTWRPRSYWYGFAAAALPHAMQNLLAFSVVCGCSNEVPVEASLLGRSSSTCMPQEQPSELGSTEAAAGLAHQP